MTRNRDVIGCDLGVSTGNNHIGQMVFWVLCALLTAVGIAVLLRPLVRGDATARPDAEINVAIYRDQLDEIDRDLDRGLINAEEAEAARLEVSRRLLATADPVDEGQKSGTIAKGLGHDRLAIIIGVALIGLPLAGYLALGRPGLPGQPHAARLKADPTKLPVEELIARVEARLREQPDDARGWDVIAPIYLKRRQYAKAARAYQRAIELNGESDRRLAQFSEAVLAATNGHVTDAVKAAYERLLKLRPEYLPAHFWLAVRHEQDGDPKAAAGAFRRLLARRDLTDQMRQLVRERLVAVAGTAPSDGEAGRGMRPSREAREEMARLSPAERQKRIRAMVDGLAERLAEDGGELAEWQRLIRAYAVLGATDKARKAFADARKAFSDKAAELRQLDAFAAGLGINPVVK